MINDLIGIICSFVKPVIRVTIANEYVIDSDTDEDLDLIVGTSREISVLINENKTNNEIVNTVENVELMEVDNVYDNSVNDMSNDNCKDNNLVIENVSVNKYDNLSN